VEPDQSDSAGLSDDFTRVYQSRNLAHSLGRVPDDQLEKLSRDCVGDLDPAEAASLLDDIRADAGVANELQFWIGQNMFALEEFPDAHQGLAVEMIRSVEALFGAEGLKKLIDRHGRLQRKAYGERLAGAATMAERVRRLAAARSDEGYMAEAKKDGRDFILIENHCPICSAAKACTGLCANELAVFADVLGKDVAVTREEHILQGARRCAYRVRGK
jgi:hypothetical protein